MSCVGRVLSSAACPVFSPHESPSPSLVRSRRGRRPDLNPKTSSQYQNCGLRLCRRLRRAATAAQIWTRSRRRCSGSWRPGAA